MRLEDLVLRAERHTPRLLARESDTRESAVAVVVRALPDDVEVLLIKRAEHEADPWSGHMAFPGGRRDPGDMDLVGTAIRETREELSLDLEKDGRLVSELDEVEAIGRGVRTGLIVRPHLFVLERDVPLVPNYEVAGVVWASLAHLRSERAHASVTYTRQGRELTLPAYGVGEHTVWGLTYLMLSTFLGLYD